MEAQISAGDLDDSVNGKREDFGKMKHGCDHYKRRCKIRAPCCNQIFTCRHCHNEAMSSLSNPKDRHELVRREVTHVVCIICEHEQPGQAETMTGIMCDVRQDWELLGSIDAGHAANNVAKVCVKCGVNMGEYFCAVCRFYDDEITKRQFHCDECGICRVGGAENFFHCPKCGSCYAIGLRDNHSCVENSMKNCCPICYEYLFDSIKGTAVMKCGHTIHMDCFSEMLHQNQYRCPICSKSVHDMTRTWERLDEEVQATPMPDEYRYKVSILCNDCSKTSEVFYHIFGHKCAQCGSYNSRIVSRVDGLQPEPAPIN